MYFYKGFPKYGVDVFGKKLYYVYGLGSAHDKKLNRVDTSAWREVGDVAGYSYYGSKTQSKEMDDIDSNNTYRGYLKLLRSKDNPYILNYSNDEYLKKIDNGDKEMRDSIVDMINNHILLDSRDLHFTIVDNVDKFTRVELNFSLPTDKELDKISSYSRVGERSYFLYRGKRRHSNCFIKLFGHLLKVDIQVYLDAKKLQFSKPFIKNSLISTLYIVKSDEGVSDEYPIITGLIGDNTPIIKDYKGCVFVEQGAFNHIYYKYLSSEIPMTSFRFLNEKDAIKATLTRIKDCNSNNNVKLKDIEKSYPNFYELSEAEILSIMQAYNIEIENIEEISDLLPFSNCIIGLVQELSGKEYGKFKRANNKIKQIVRIPIVK